MTQIVDVCALHNRLTLWLVCAAGVLLASPRSVASSAMSEVILHIHTHIDRRHDS